MLKGGVFLVLCVFVWEGVVSQKDFPVEMCTKATATSIADTDICCPTDISPPPLYSPFITLPQQCNGCGETCDNADNCCCQGCCRQRCICHALGPEFWKLQCLDLGPKLNGLSLYEGTNVYEKFGEGEYEGGEGEWGEADMGHFRQLLAQVTSYYQNHDPPYYVGNAASDSPVPIPCRVFLPNFIPNEGNSGIHNRCTEAAQALVALRFNVEAARCEDNLHYCYRFHETDDDDDDDDDDDATPPRSYLEYSNRQEGTEPANDDCIGIQKSCFYTYQDDEDHGCTPPLRVTLADEIEDRDQSGEVTESTESDTDEDVPCYLYTGNPDGVCDPVAVLETMEPLFWLRGMAFNVYTNKLCDDIAECANSLLDYAGKQNDDYWECPCAMPGGQTCASADAYQAWGLDDCDSCTDTTNCVATDYLCKYEDLRSLYIEGGQRIYQYELAHPDWMKSLPKTCAQNAPLAPSSIMCSSCQSSCLTCPECCRNLTETECQTCIDKHCSAPVCFPERCNVCDECCKDYILTQEDCTECMQEKCSPKRNAVKSLYVSDFTHRTGSVCSSKSQECLACSQCCQDFETAEECDVCVSTHCDTPDCTPANCNVCPECCPEDREMSPYVCSECALEKCGMTFGNVGNSLYLSFGTSVLAITIFFFLSFN